MANHDQLNQAEARLLAAVSAEFAALREAIPDECPEPAPEEPAPAGDYTGGTGGPLNDRTFLTYTNSAGTTSRYHLYAGGLDWSKDVGLLVYTDGSAEYGLKNPTSTYLLAGSNGLVAVAKRLNMVLLTPLAPGTGCPDGDGTCWYQSSGGYSTEGKTRWSADLVKHVHGLYNIDRSRTVFGGYSSGAQWTTEFFGPAHAAGLVSDGVAVAISYGGAPILTPRFTEDFKAKVPFVWDVGEDDYAWYGGGRYGVKAGHDWYQANGFTTQLHVIPNLGHGRSGQFGGIIEREATEHVRPA